MVRRLRVEWFSLEARPAVPLPDASTPVTAGWPGGRDLLLRWPPMLLGLELEGTPYFREVLQSLQTPVSETLSGQGGSWIRQFGETL